MKALPEISDSDLQIWDSERNKCAGFLNKKASQSSAFSKGKWQKRWFVVQTDLDDTENYTLQYFHSPEEKTPRSTLPLAHCSVKITNDTTFVINFSDKTSMSLAADSSDVMKLWIQTLEKVATVANMRDKMLDHYDRMSESSEPLPKNRKTAMRDEDDSASQGSQGLHRAQDASRGVAQHVHRGVPFPMFRIDVDINAMPPTSAERHQFISLLTADLANTLHVEEDVVQILSLRSAPGKDWLTLVEFNFNLHNSSDPELEEDEQTLASVASHPTARSKASAASRAVAAVPTPKEVFTKRDYVKKQLLQTLLNMITDSSSALFMGFMTSRIDPSYTDSLRRVIDGMSAREDALQQGALSELDHDPTDDTDHTDGGPVELYSSDARVLQIMHKYADVDLHSPLQEATTVVDYYSHLNTRDCFLHIHLHFEDRIGTLRVLNPDVFADRECVLYVFEVQQALGMLGTLQELHLRPTGLVPRTPTKNMVRQPGNPHGTIPFRASVRHGGLLIISARSLVGCTEFELDCEDDRDEILNSLSKEEMSIIKETYQQLEEFNASAGTQEEGAGVSIVKYEEIMHGRIHHYYALIEEQYQAYVSENRLQITKDTPSHHSHYIEEELKLVLLKKQQFEQSLHETYMRCVLLLQASNVFANLHISFTEFILIESWWLRCAIHPERAHLF